MNIENLAKRYFEGNATHAEQLQLLKCLRDSENNKRLFQKLKQDWLNDDEKPISLSTWKKWEKLKIKISAPQKRSILFLNLRKAAGLIAIGLLISFITALPIINKQKIVLNTGAGQTLKLLLPDSSTVLLNSSSSLEYSPLHFLFSRNVKLTGEAYFEVKHKTMRPFRVQTSQLKVTVLGTKFNIQDYNTSDKAFVVLEEGSVKLTSFQSNKQIRILKPGEIAGLLKSANRWEVKKVNTKLFTSWTDGKLYFYDTPFREIASQLQKRYGIKVTVNDKELESFLFSTTISNESLQEILDLIRIALPVKIKSQNKEIIFSLDQRRYSKYTDLE
ncbi:FecR family protein [Geofilum sp. OHC36d9]|uniref:FecR family protein n=1 Tax=Geofilum sp. OHC36d9 TaxID=3458413 RepID=UPI004033E087